METERIINKIEVIDSCRFYEVRSGRDSRGRFTYGNTFSIGNKGGRPRDVTLSDLESNPNIIQDLFNDFSENGNHKSLKTLLNFFDGKLK